MAKKKEGENAPKPTGPPPDPNALLEVEKQFYELQLEELNRQLARYKGQCTTLENENEEVKKSMAKLDEDRGDVIIFLKRSVQQKTEEMAEMAERMKALEEAKIAERNNFQRKIQQMESDFKVMHEQLTSEIKLLNGKLNSLEEFRAGREELMNKFLQQEEVMEEQERTHKRMLYEVEKKFLISKDKLRQEMEGKLLQLSLDFQKATQTRIASTTQSVIRENIAINNELNILMKAWEELYDENDDLKAHKKKLVTEVSVMTDTMNKTMEYNVMLNQVIDRLVYEHTKMSTAYQDFQRCLKVGHKLNNELDKMRNKYKKLECTLKKSVQKNENLCSKIVELERQVANLKVHNHRLEGVIDQALEGVQILHNMQGTKDPSKCIKRSAADQAIWEKRQEILETLLEVLKDETLIVTEEPEGAKSVETIIVPDWADRYLRGDLGVFLDPDHYREDEKEEIKPKDVNDSEESF